MLGEVFCDRHIGLSDSDLRTMLASLDLQSLDDLTNRALPECIQLKEEFSLSRFATPLSEKDLLARARELAAKNKLFRSYIGMGYYDTIVPSVILRNILENPGWYTQYTPYQPEISQGRLEALLVYQTMVSELSGFAVANASLLDEGTAAAEAMSMSYGLYAKKNKKAANSFLVSKHCHPQTIGVLETRAKALGIELVIADHRKMQLDKDVFGLLLQYPATCGEVWDYEDFIKKAHKHNILVSVAADLMALVLLKAPAEFGADIAIGSTQRFGVPLGFGGPHAAYLATKAEYQRALPGRLVGVSKDSDDNPALRLSLQTREQHIRREKATSNICTAQVLLAIMAGMYGVYHGPKGLKQIAERINHMAKLLAAGLKKSGVNLKSEAFFDTLHIELEAKKLQELIDKAKAKQINFRVVDDTSLCIALDEVTSLADLNTILALFDAPTIDAKQKVVESVPAALQRNTEFLSQDVFNSYHSETEFLRYINRLASKDLSLAVSMIPLGSCTMKLNATTEMLPITWQEFTALHPFVPADQAEGYKVLMDELASALKDITAFEEISFQPNAGSQGEYAGLVTIAAYHKARGEEYRNVCLIPQSAHGTNPASAVMVGMKVVPIECDEAGNISLSDLEAKAKEHKDKLSALMVTYPSTHGVFEEGILQVAKIVHEHGGQVYLDGANLNALVGLSKVAELGADVCHMNLHKTFSIPHGGGGPGMGPIGVKAHLVPHLPGHSVVPLYDGKKDGAVSSAPWGSPCILPISWAYIAMMGAKGLKKASQVAILNANYVAKRLNDHYPVLYKGQGGFVAHECILDLRHFKKSANVEVEDVAKRLMDYGFHAPTISWPVPGTMMVEPTESESKVELDRFCEALIAIRAEIADIENGVADKENNLLKNAPHTALHLAADEWSHPYSRTQAAFPSSWTKQYKFWPAVGRIDSSWGDRNLCCSW